jgi:AmmeMemoRadiSam system protein B
MEKMAEYPKLRSNFRADNFIIKDGQKYVVVSDVLIQGRDSQKKLALPGKLWQVARLMNGTADIDTLCEYATNLFWTDVKRSDIEGVVSQLDEFFLLDNDRYREKLKQCRESMEHGRYRRIINDPKYFSPEYEDLREEIDRTFLSPYGPGSLPDEAGHSPEHRLLGVIAPHGNYGVSGPCAAHAYREIFLSGPFDLFVIIGYNHIYANNMIESLHKDVETPLGKIRVDGEFGNAVLDKRPGTITQGGVANYLEHSIDMQIPMLQYILNRNGNEAKIYPFILANKPKMESVTDALNFRKVISNVGAAVREVIREQGKKVCIIASGDFTHLGPYYGTAEVTEADIASIYKFDHTNIDMIVRMQKDAFYKHTIESNYCCITPIYFMLSVLGPDCKGKLLKYYTSWDVLGKQDNINTFAALGFYTD